MSSLMPFQKITRTYRHLARLRKILSVIFRNGFGFLFDKLKGLLPEKSLWKLDETGQFSGQHAGTPALHHGRIGAYVR